MRQCPARAIVEPAQPVERQWSLAPASGDAIARCPCPARARPPGARCQARCQAVTVPGPVRRPGPVVAPVPGGGGPAVSGAAVTVPGAGGQARCPCPADCCVTCARCPWWPAAARCPVRWPGPWRWRLVVRPVVPGEERWAGGGGGEVCRAGRPTVLARSPAVRWWYWQ